MTLMARVLAALACALTLAGPAWAQTPKAATPAADDAPEQLLSRMQAALQAGNRDAFATLFAASVAPDDLADFSNTFFIDGATHTNVQERDRSPLEGAPAGDGYRLVVELFIETPGRAKILTVALDVRRPPRGAAESWRIVGGEGLTTVEGLYKLRLSPSTQYTARDLIVATEDFQLTLSEGTVFPIEGDDGVTGLVLLGRGEMKFAPSPDTEKGQVRIFSGSDTVTTPFEAAMVRFNPSDYASTVHTDALTPLATVDPRLTRRAQEVFLREGPKSFSLDLEDLSRDTWYLLPPANDFLAEVQTRRWGTLTFARTGQQAEDLTLFSREKQRTISLYPSKAKLAAGGRFFTDDDQLDYDILDTNIEAQVVPGRQFIQGRARLLMRIRTDGTSTLTLRLADPLEVSSIVSLEYGRLLHLRVRGQNSIIVNLPVTLMRDADLTLVINYSGRLTPQETDNESLQVEAIPDEIHSFQPEPNYLLSSRSYWYPQNGISDYSTATLRITVPPGYSCIASGQPAGTATDVTLHDLMTVPAGRAYVFRANEPLRYLAFIVSKFKRVAQSTITLTEPDGRPRRDRARNTVALAVEANPKLESRGRDLLKPVEDIMKFYAGVMGDVPYASVTVALVESTLPGGHSPGYFAVVNSPQPSAAPTWRNDPAAFTNYPDFFLAHELAHQWWGQGVGWKNYHEQWLSEGFAQYFAALYAEQSRGPDTFANMIRQFRRWTLDESDEGPVHLGYRLGHIKNDSRIFRALVYNKGAGVLHMLRRWLGDEAFFNAIRRFYDDWKFRKAGTDDLRQEFEAESGKPLSRFFERWIYGSALPTLRYTAAVEGTDVVVRFEQLQEDIFDLPVTVSITYSNGKTQDIVVPVTDKKVEYRAKAEMPVRQIRVNRDNAALANFVEP